MNGFGRAEQLSSIILLGASAFWLFLPALLVPSIRRKFVKLFTPTAPVTQGSIDGLDGLRGLASLGIAGFHLYSWLKPYFDPVAEIVPGFSQLYKSVPLFVIISGLLIYRSLQNLQRIEELKWYAQRRFLRIYPLYAVAIIVYFSFFSTYVQPEPPSWTQRMIAELFMMKIFGYALYFYSPTWSLYVEELFYLSAPIWTACSRNSPKTWSLVGFSVFSLIGSALPDELAIVKYFFVGIFLCEVLKTRKWQEVGNLSSGALLLFGIVLLVLEGTVGDVFGGYLSGFSRIFGFELVFNTPFNPYDPFKHYYSITLGIGLGAVVLSATKFYPLVRTLNLFPFRFLGSISYSIFIWNGMIITWDARDRMSAFIPAYSAGSFGNTYLQSGSVSQILLAYFPAFIFFAAISYLVVERPFLLKRKRMSMEGVRGSGPTKR